MVNLLKNNTWRDVGTISQVLAHLTAKLKVSPKLSPWLSRMLAERTYWMSYSELLSAPTSFEN